MIFLLRLFLKDAKEPEFLIADGSLFHNLGPLMLISLEPVSVSALLLDKSFEYLVARPLMC